MPEARIVIHATSLKARIVRSWLVVRPAFFVLLCVLPLTIYSSSEALELWPIPIMAVVAASIPASGAPVAGGVIFLPVLHTMGVCPRDAVAFSAATQFFGVGIFAPLNWLAKDSSVFLPDALRISIVPSTLGITASLTYYKVYGCHGDHYVIGIFAIFCLILAVYTGIGLFRSKLNVASTSVKSTAPNLLSSSTAVCWFIPCVFGGMLTGYIGVSIEKVVFIMLTLSDTVHVRTATVTSITLVGWLSGIAFLWHMFSPCDPDTPQYIGAIPYGLWIMSLPGILVGSILGPKMNEIFGSTNVLFAFVCIMFYEAVTNAMLVLQARFDAPCVDYNMEQECKPQHDNMVVVGHILTTVVPWSTFSNDTLQ